MNPFFKSQKQSEYMNLSILLFTHLTSSKILLSTLLQMTLFVYLLSIFTQLIVFRYIIYWHPATSSSTRFRSSCNLLFNSYSFIVIIFAWLDVIHCHSFSTRLSFHKRPLIKIIYWKKYKKDFVRNIQIVLILTF